MCDGVARMGANRQLELLARLVEGSDPVVVDAVLPIQDGRIDLAEFLDVGTGTNTGTVVINGNLDVVGNVNFVGNINVIDIAHGEFTGDPTTGVSAGMPFVTASNIGGLTAGTVYYILSVVNAGNNSTFTVSATPLSSSAPAQSTPGPAPAPVITAALTPVFA